MAAKPKTVQAHEPPKRKRLALAAQASNGRHALETEIRAFESHRSELESQYSGKFVVFHKTDRAGIFDDFDSAAKEAIRQFGRGPYLIRQIGALPPSEASMLFHLSVR